MQKLVGARRSPATLLASAIYLSIGIAGAQERQPGTAIIRVGDTEYVIPIECYDPAGPESRKINPGATPQ